VVVGGGPAGATAARHLASRGVSVTIVDKSPFPRNKPCGGGISLRILKRFPYLQPQLSRIATHELSRLYLEGPDGANTVVTSARPAAVMIRRVEFDALLVNLAREAGADVVAPFDVVKASESPDVIELTARDGRSIRAPVVIAADGVHSVVARRLGMNPGWRPGSVALDMMEETPRDCLRDIDPSTLWVGYGYGSSAGKAAAEGYAYIFPKRDHVNIGIGYVLDYYRRHVAGAPYDLQKTFVRALRSRGVVEGESVRGNFTPFLIPVGGPLHETARRRVALAGDAGGFVNAFTAEGIYYAMVTGELAAAAAVAHLADGRHFGRSYERAWRAEIGPELRDSVLIQRYLFADRRRIKAVIDSARADVALTRLVLEFADGRRTYRSLRRSMLARAPRLAAALLWELLKRRNGALTVRAGGREPAAHHRQLDIGT
jgi:geranylgeranyl reductase family protein